MSKYLKKPWIVLSVLIAVFSIAYACCGRPTKKTITFSELIDPMMCKVYNPRIGLLAPRLGMLEPGRRILCGNNLTKGLPVCYPGERFWV